MTTEDQKAREEFEAWVASQCDDDPRAPFSVADACERELDGEQHYTFRPTQDAWDAWQASRRTYRATVLEEAALACEKVGDDYGESEGGRWPELKSDAQTGARDCESAIRALIPCAGANCGATTGSGTPDAQA